MVMQAIQKFKHFLKGEQLFEVYTDHMMLKILITHENLSSQRIQQIKKMVSFNFTIHYQPGVKIGHVDFTLRMDTYLPKNSTSISTSTLREKLSDYIQPKQTQPLIIKSNELIINKKAKCNSMTPFRKVKYIRKKKTYNRHYC